MVLFEVIAVFTIIAMIVVVAKDLAGSDRVIRNLVAEDISMIVNSLASVPGEIQVVYPYSKRDLTNYTLSINNNQVSVKSTKKDKILTTTRIVHVPEGYTVAGVVQNVASFCMSKKNKDIILSGKCT